jgi:hypothetical protein
MSTIGTQKQVIKKYIQRTVSSTIDDDIILVELIDAVNSLKYKRFFFNEAPNVELTLELEDEVVTPGDTILRIDTMRLLDIEQNIEYDLTQNERSIEFIRNINYDPDSYSMPCYWTMYSEDLVFAPKPEKEYTLFIDYIKDIGSCSYSSSGTFTFFDPSGNVLSDAFSNDWFTHGEMVVRYRALWKLYENYIRDEKEAASALTQYQLALIELRERSRLFSKQIVKRPSLGLL